MSDFTFILDRAGLDKLLEGTDGPVAKHLSSAGVKVDRRAKELCAVDTGRLRSSINWRLARDSRGLAAIIGTNVEYAPYLEFGTSRMAARPFLRPALGAAS